MRYISVVCTLLAGLAAFAGEPAAYGGLITLSVSANAGAGTYDVFAQITDTTGTGGNIITGIAGFAIDVTGSGGVTITSALNASPNGSNITGFTTGVTNNQAIAGGFRAGALQNTAGGPGPLVLQGVGITAGSDAFGASWALPVRLATGTFTGTGTLTASPTGSAINVMQGPGGVWAGGGGSIIAVTANPVAINVSAVPEPSTFLAVAAAMSVAGLCRYRRRRIAKSEQSEVVA